MAEPLAFVLLDSSVLVSEGRWSLAVHRLVRAIRRGLIVCFIPEIVLNEAATVIARNVGPKFSAAPIRRAVQWVSDFRCRQLTENIDALHSGLQDLRGQVLAGLNDWTERHGIRVDPLTNANTDAVFAGYFSGAPPFNSPNSKEDLPDGFVFDSVRRLSNDNHPFSAVTSDKRLREACAGIDNVQVFSNIEELLSSFSPIAEAIIKMEVELRDSWFERASDYCRRHGRVLEDAIEEQLEPEFQGIEVGGSLPSDDGEATVEHASRIDANIDVDSVEPWDENSVTIEVTGVAEECLLDLFVYKSDFWSMGDEAIGRYSVADGNWNSHYVWAQTYRDIEFEARAVLTLSENEEEDSFTLEEVEIEGLDSLTVRTNE